MPDECLEEDDKKYSGFFSFNLQPSLDCRIVGMEAQEIHLRDFSSSLHSFMTYSQKTWSRVFGLL